jgi:hypothetical protein
MLSLEQTLTAFVSLSRQIFGQACVSFVKTAQMDSSPRFVEVVRPLDEDVLGFLDNYFNGDTSVMQHRTFNGAKWHAQLTGTLVASFQEICLAS